MEVDISTMQRFFRSESVQSKYLVGLSKILQVPVKVFFGEEWETPPAPAATIRISLDSDHGQPVQRFFYGFIFQEEQPEVLEKLKAIKVTDLEDL